MKILLTTPSMEVGGAERVVTILAECLAARGHTIGLAAPRGALDADMIGTPHTRMTLREDGRAVIGAMRSTLSLTSAIRGFDPDVVHAQNVKSAVTARAGATLARGSGRPAILATFHGVLPAEYRRAAKLLRSADHVACVSSDLLARILAAGLPAAKASLIRNAIDLPPPLTDERRAALDRELELADAPTVAIVGRLVPQKAHGRFLTAANIVSRSIPEARFLIVGEGPRRESIEQSIQAAGLQDRVRLTGRRSDAREIIARAQVLVFSSEWEGLSIAALEALAAGTPVVSTDVQGMRELLAGGAGAIVALDDGTELGQRIATLLADRAEQAEMGRLGRELIESEFSLNGMVESYERLYELLAGASGRSAHGRPSSRTS
ncbi:MAG TPA: glycosyltransferase [Solirubrobacteraceae bacterium]